MLATIFWFIVIIGVSVAVHEFGHYLASKWQKVEVPAFSIGFGPVLWHRKWRDTDWRLSAIPLGGYAEIAGMAQEPGETPSGFSALKLPGKLLILVAGIAMNILLAWVLLTFTYHFQGFPEPDPERPWAQVGQVLDSSLANQIGLEAGDQIVAIDGVPLTQPTELDRAKVPGSHTLTVNRGQETLELELTWSESDSQLGITYGPVSKLTPLPLAQAFTKAVSVSWQIFPQAISTFGSTIGGMFQGDLPDDVAGPVGIVQIIGQASQQGVYSILGLAAMINVSLAIFNLLPIPGLDGGHMLLNIIKSAAGGYLAPQIENIVGLLGFAFLIMLFLAVTIQDVQRLVGGGP